MRQRSFLLVLIVALCATPVLGQVSPPVLKVEDGGTGASTPAAARTNLGAAAAGPNGDITALTGLTTVLPTSEGGTGTTGGVSPTGSLTTTPETVINLADYGGCSGSPSSDTANLNSALAAARSSTSYTSNQPVRVVGGFSTNGVACAVTQVNATGFTRFGGGARLLIEDLTLSCSGAGSICLDTLGSLNVQFNKVTIIGSSTSPPMIGLQEGNTAPATIACCIHTHYGLEITGSFTFAGLYSAASEIHDLLLADRQEQWRQSRRHWRSRLDFWRRRLCQWVLYQRPVDRFRDWLWSNRKYRRFRRRSHWRHLDEPRKAIRDS